MNYALLIYRKAPPSVPIPELEERAALDGHRALQAEASASGELFAVARLDEPETARTVHPVASPHEITDGPFIETKEWLVGFYVIECANEEQALARARMICPDQSHVIEVRPVSWRWRP
ncbi:MAG TPA: YciI family protein [Polyangiaceae bacterium]